MGGAGDVDGDGDVDAADLSRLIAEIFDGDGEDSAAVAGGDVFSSAAAETNGDARVDAADLVGWWQRR